MSEETKEYLENLGSKDYNMLKDFFDNYNKGKEKIKIQDVSPEILQNMLENLENGERRKASFRLHSKRAMDNYMENDKWSNLEEITRDILEELGLEEGKDWYHNFKLHNEEGSGYFELDFILPSKKIVIEADGEVWHSAMGDANEKDERRDKWLSRLGYKTVRIPGDILYTERSRAKRMIESVVGNAGKRWNLEIKVRDNKDKEVRKTLDLNKITSKKLLGRCLDMLKTSAIDEIEEV